MLPPPVPGPPPRPPPGAPGSPLSWSQFPPPSQHSGGVLGALTRLYPPQRSPVTLSGGPVAGTPATSQMPSGAGSGAVARGTTTPRAKVRRGAQGRPPDPDSRGRGARGAEPLQPGPPTAQTLVPPQATSCSWTPRTPPPGAPLPTCSPSPRRPQPLRSVSPSGSTSTVPRSVRPPSWAGPQGSLTGARGPASCPLGCLGGVERQGSGPCPLPTPCL